jgi:hypothetical protein
VATKKHRKMVKKIAKDRQRAEELADEFVRRLDPAA